VRRIILIFLLASRFIATAQHSSNEWRWAFFHPFAALKVKKITRQCDQLVKNKNISLDGQINGGKLDAFRHVFYMAAYARKMGTRKLRRLGLAHEKGNKKMFTRGVLEEGELPDSLSTVMDLKNNEVGFTIGKENRKAALDELCGIVLDRIKKGDAVIMKRDGGGNYLTCDDRPVIIRKKSWNIPKCLVRSNYTYK
jgi:hypothetical protein